MNAFESAYRKCPELLQLLSSSSVQAGSATGVRNHWRSGLFACVAVAAPELLPGDPSARPSAVALVVLSIWWKSSRFGFQIGHEARRSLEFIWNIMELYNCPSQHQYVSFISLIPKVFGTG